MDVTDSRKFNDRLLIKVDRDVKVQIQRAAKHRDGGNVSHMVRRAIDRLIEEEQLLDDESNQKAGVA